MPTYGYRCTNCGKSLEVMQKITDGPLKLCPHCQKEALTRGPGGGIGLEFTGSGFYKTDYPSSSPQNKPPESSGPSGQCCPCGKNKPSCS